MKRSRTIGWILFAALVVLPAPTLRAAAPPKAEPVGAIRVTTDPAGATVFCDGRQYDGFPVMISNLTTGEHLVIANKVGYREGRATAVVKAGQVLALDVRLEPLYGLLLVQSDPAGAEVQLNGADRGKTPLLLTDVLLGKHRIRVSSSGYAPREADVDLLDRTPRLVAISLTSSAASLTIDTTPSGATVLVNGANKGTTPCTLDRVPQGDVEIELTLEGYASVKKTIRLVAGAKEQVNLPLKAIPARLMIVSIPAGARIYVNNEFRGNSPITLDDLPAGMYRLRAEQPLHEPMARTVELKNGDKITEEFRLTSTKSALSVTTKPAGVAVLVDGKEVGVTPDKRDGTNQVAGAESEVLLVDLSTLGKHEVQLVKKSYETKTFSIEAEQDKTVTLTHEMVRRFVPDYEVRTATETIRGVLVYVNAAGDVRLEIRPGVYKTFLAEEVRVRRPLEEPRPGPAPAP